MNAARVAFEEAFASVTVSNPKVSHVSHFGLMQNTYGFPDQNIAPEMILPPGDISLPNLVESMCITAGIFVDCFHLGADGYEVLVQNLFDDYYQYHFDTVFKSLFKQQTAGLNGHAFATTSKTQAFGGGSFDAGPIGID